MNVLAIDQGTTSTKAHVLFDDGRFETVGGIAHQQHFPGPGRVEHDAGEIAAAVETLIGRAVAAHGVPDAVALANQGETVVAWDRDTRQPLHRAIVWQDQRTQPRLDGFGAAQKALVAERAGLPLDAYFSASKLAWLLREVPEVAAAAAAGRLGLATSDVFLLGRLTGRYATDAATASRTSLMDLDRRCWDGDLAALFGVPLALLPPILPCAGDFGPVQIGGAERPLTASLVDQQAALYGHGCRAAGDAKITFGTGTFALAVSGPVPVRGREGLVPTLAWQLPGEAALYALDAGDFTAAAAIGWGRSLGLPMDGALGPGPSAIERGLVFVPALAGLAAPHWDRGAGGLFLGLRQDTTPADMARAIWEGIALRAVELLEALIGADAAGAVSVDGGLTHDDGFVQFLADALGRPARRRASADLTALGVAMLGFVGLGAEPPPVSTAGDRLVEPSAAGAAIRDARPLFARAVERSKGWFG
ncbi:FGGY family carbohydrate kinase [Labrys wisconsinensis]|uniref:ATP:glycerol 3-phosphotransferase n=1 Tax=Labrys wisconsinensis TaxID=425677 RepID=A0ABU0JJK6_9HYPH|nr:FGGY family carbohydrate kinase [Labrys wisconsinensis]MDQ0473790.1 glycerol kinase [Labrys wisconsinensis]